MRLRNPAPEAVAAVYASVGDRGNATGIRARTGASEILRIVRRYNQRKRLRSLVAQVFSVYERESMEQLVSMEHLVWSN